MSFLDMVEAEMIEAAPVYKTVAPGPLAAINKSQLKLVVKLGAAGWKVRKTWKQHKQGKKVSTMIGEHLGGKVVGKLAKPIREPIKQAHIDATRYHFDWSRKNGIGGRSWLMPGRHDLVIIYHDANRAGKHIDVHIGRLSFIYRVKPELEAQIKLKADGTLTNASKEAIVKHVRREFEAGGFTPQNVDHTKRNARASWLNGDVTSKAYGAGLTRQIVLEERAGVEVYKAHWDGPIEFVAPAINPHGSCYIYRIFPGESRRGKTRKAPILVAGNRASKPPKLQDRLHLTMIDPSDSERIAAKCDPATSTLKYDGASCHWKVNKDGTLVFSPRVSKTTGKQIEYTPKVNGLAQTTNDVTIQGMGELMFERKPTGIRRVTSRIGGRPSGDFIPAAQVGGILNSHDLVPDGYQARIYIYEVHTLDGKDVRDIGFWENRKLQEQVAALDPHFRVVELGSLDDARERGFEGVVMAPPGGTVQDGFKVKLWGDASDWRIISVDLHPGEKGGIAGNVHCVSLESHKEFNLGSGQIGERALCEDMMNNPQLYEGTVVKVNNKHGHEGRASKVVGLHQDKGYAPV